MNILLACNNSSVLNTILFIKHLIDIIFIVAPIVLVLLLTIDIAKNVMSKDDSENKKNINIAIKRVVYCLALFFVPLIIDGVMSYLDSYNINFATCYEKATEENVKQYYAEETKRDEEKQAEINKERVENANKVNTEINNEENAAKLAAESAAKKAAAAAQKSAEESSYTDDCTNCETSKKIAKKAISLAWPKGTSKSTAKYPGGSATKEFTAALKKYYHGKLFWSRASRKGASCDVYIGTVVRATGYDQKFPAGLRSQIKHMNKSSKWKKVNCEGQLSCLQPGDILYSKHNKSSSLNNGHIYMYIGNNQAAQASAGDYYGKITKYSDRRKLKKVRYVSVYRAANQ